MSESQGGDTFKEVSHYPVSAHRSDVGTAREATGLLSDTSPWAAPEVVHGETDTAKEATTRLPDKSPWADPEALPSHDDDAKAFQKPPFRTRKKLIILAAVLLVAIGAVVGGAVGGTVGKHHASDNDDTVNPQNGTVLSNTHIAAANWTNSGGDELHGVFWQASSTHLILSIWRSDTEDWTVTNISSSTSTSAKPGTALAAGVRGPPFTDQSYGFGAFGIALFYIENGDSVAQVSCTDRDGIVWGPGDLSKPDINTVTAGNNSQLAVKWDVCGVDECTGDLLLAYQDKDNSVRLMNSSNWNAEAATLAESLPAGTPLSMVATNSRKAGTNDRWDGASSIRLYNVDPDTLQEHVWDSPGPWKTNHDITAQVAPNPGLSAVGFEQNTSPESGPVNVLVTFMYDNGFILASYWDNSTWSNPQAPSISGTNHKTFSSGALMDGRNMKFYGLASDGTIQSMTVNRTDPLQWAYDSAVKIDDKA